MTIGYNALKPGSVGQIVAQYAFDSGADDKEIRWLSYDGVGTVLGLSDESGILVKTYDQDLYGNVLSNVNTGEWADTFGSPHMNTKEYDEDSEHYNMGNDWYDPRTGRGTRGNQGDPGQGGPGGNPGGGGGRDGGGGGVEPTPGDPGFGTPTDTPTDTPIRRHRLGYDNDGDGVPDLFPLERYVKRDDNSPTKESLKGAAETVVGKIADPIEGTSAVQAGLLYPLVKTQGKQLDWGHDQIDGPIPDTPTKTPTPTLPPGVPTPTFTPDPSLDNLKRASGEWWDDVCEWWDSRE